MVNWTRLFNLRMIYRHHKNYSFAYYLCLYSITPYFSLYLPLLQPPLYAWLLFHSVTQSSTLSFIACSFITTPSNPILTQSLTQSSCIVFPSFSYSQHIFSSMFPVVGMWYCGSCLDGCWIHSERTPPGWLFMAPDCVESRLKLTCVLLDSRKICFRWCGSCWHFGHRLSKVG